MSTTIPDSAIREMANEMAQMRLEIDMLKQGFRSTQLGNSVIDDGSLLARDNNGDIRAYFGKQPDGTFGLGYSNGEPPARPNTPQVTPSMAGLIVAWNGELVTGIPLGDFKCVKMYVSPAGPTFVHGESNHRGTFVQAGEIPVGPLAYDTDYWVRFVAVSASGKESIPSLTAGPYRPSRLLGSELFPNSITGTEIAPDSVKTPHLSANAVTALNIIAEAIKGYHISAGSITADKLDAILVLASRIIAGDPNDWHLEMGADDVPLLYWNNDQTGFALTRDATTGLANIFLSGRVSFGYGSQIDSDMVDIMNLPSTGWQTPKLRQQVRWMDSGPKSSVTAKWFGGTKRGTLVLMAVYQVASSGSVAPNCGTPPGATLVDSRVSGTTRLTLFAVPNSPTSRTSETFGSSAAAAKWGIFLMEYEGVTTLDVNGFATGAGPTASSGTTGTPSQANELQFAVFGAPNLGFSNGANNQWSAPTNGFTKIAEGDGAGLQSIAISTRHATSIAPASTTLNPKSSVQWTGLIATFRCAPADGDPPPPPPDTARLYSKRRQNRSTLHVVESDGRNYPIGRGPFCQVRLTANVLLAGNTDIWAQGDWTIDSDVEGMAAIGTGGVFSSIQVPISGYYLCDYNGLWANTTNVGDTFSSFISRNGRPTTGRLATDGRKGVDKGSDGTPTRAWDIIPLNAGDILYWGNWSSVNAYLIGAAGTGPKTKITVEFRRPL